VRRRVERHVCLVGGYHHIGAGDRLPGEVVLRVVGYAEATVNRVLVAGWTDIRIEQALAKLITSGTGTCSTGCSQTAFPTL
jgi:hypothetical protein